MTAIVVQTGIHQAPLLRILWIQGIIALRCVLICQIAADNVRIAHDGAVIIEHGDRVLRIQLEKLGGFVLSGLYVDQSGKR